MSKMWQGDVINSRFAEPTSGVMPRHVLCAIGVGLDLDVLKRAVDEAGGGEFVVEELQSSPDPRMRSAFDASLEARQFTHDDRFGDDDWAAVDAHDSVAYVLSPPMYRSTAFDVSRRALAVTAALLANGATAVKNDSSGVACGRERWLALAERAESAEDLYDLAAALVQAWVVSVIPDTEPDEVVYYSCGMHLLGEADVELAPGPVEDVEMLQEIVTVMTVAAFYLLTEQPEHGVEDGEGFRASPDAPRWVMNRVECERFEEDDFFHNPYGYWLLTPG
jgi:hypothetical protein